MTEGCGLLREVLRDVEEGKSQREDIADEDWLLGDLHQQGHSLYMQIGKRAKTKRF